jgi:signal transduction histidine kinase
LTTRTLESSGGRFIVESAGTFLRTGTDCAGQIGTYSWRMVWPRRIATAAGIASGTLLMASAALVLLAPSSASAINLALGLTVAPLSAALGVAIAGRPTSASRIGILLAALALAVSVIVTREAAGPFLAARQDVAASWSWLVAAMAESAIWVLAVIALLLVSFPDGRLPGTRWRWVPGLVLVAALVTHLYGAFDTGPFRPPLEELSRPFGPPPAWLDVVALIAFLALLAMTIACALSQVVRFRRSDRTTRDQIKWLAVGGLGVALFPVVCGLEILAVGAAGALSAALGIAGLVGVPIAIAVAILRHDLYDVDKALAGAIAWGLLTAALVAVYVLTSLVTGLALGQESGVLAAAGTTAAAFLLYPLRRHVQRAVDGRLYPRRRAAFEALDALHRDAGSGRSAPEALQGVLRTALRDEALVVGFRMPGSDDYVDPAGTPVRPDGGCRIEVDGRAIGVLVPGPNGPSAALVRDVAARAASLVDVIRLRLELATALREVEASRARLVRIGYEERRRLERDLHDGAQQRLVSLGMAVRLAQRHLDEGTVDVAGLLDETVAQLSTAVAELRQLAQGIRPSSLDDGLDAAVARLVQNLPIAVDMEVLAGPLPDEVATTAYFVISEAVANAVKHADASRIGLRVVQEAGRVVVRVSDDGRGGARLHERSGLADRVAALGGSLAVESAVGRGTTIEAALPCAS